MRMVPEKQGVKSNILVITQSPVVSVSVKTEHAQSHGPHHLWEQAPQLLRRNKNVPRFLFSMSPKGRKPSPTAGVGEELHAEPPWRSGSCLPPPEPTLQEQFF